MAINSKSYPLVYNHVKVVENKSVSQREMGLGVGRAGESFLLRVVRWRYGDNYDNFHSIYDSNVSSSIGEVSKWFSRERISVYHYYFNALCSKTTA